MTIKLHEELKLWKNGIPFLNPDADTPNLLTTYLIHTVERLPCVIVVPGGGYHGRAPHEEGVIAETFNNFGMQAVVLGYRTAPNRHPAPLADIQRAIRVVRANAKEWRIDPNRVVVCGFSAGGHLCAAASTLDAVELPADYVPDEIDALPCRPDGAILGYPVISLKSDFGHVGSGDNLLGDTDPDGSLRDYLCLQNRVTEQTSKTFLWHTSNDGAVNVRNSLVYAEALRNHGVLFEMHVFPDGPHGLGLSPSRPDVAQWPALAAAWIKKNI